jgi:hypothetical protein
VAGERGEEESGKVLGGQEWVASVRGKLVWGATGKRFPGPDFHTSRQLSLRPVGGFEALIEGDSVPRFY